MDSKCGILLGWQQATKHNTVACGDDKPVHGVHLLHTVQALVQDIRIRYRCSWRCDTKPLVNCFTKAIPLTVKEQPPRRTAEGVDDDVRCSLWWDPGPNQTGDCRFTSKTNNMNTHCNDQTQNSNSSRSHDRIVTGRRRDFHVPDAIRTVTIQHGCAKNPFWV